MTRHSDFVHTTLRAAVLAALFAGSAVCSPVLAAGRVDASALRDASVHDRFIVKYRDGSVERRNPGQLQGMLDGVAKRAGATMAPPSAARAMPASGLALRHLRRLAVGADAIQSSRKLSQDDALALMREIAADPDVEYVEIDARKRAYVTPNDTYYASEQWDLFDATSGINMPSAWNASTGAGVVVAVLDTGTTTHSDLSSHVLAGYDFIGDIDTARDGNGRDSSPKDEGDWTAAKECDDPDHVAEESSWHGTHVAGTIGAITNNAKGVAGVAYNTRILPVRVLGKCGGYTSDIADAIVWASGGGVSGVPANANPAEVINLSLGGSGACSATEQSAINGAVSRGTTVVVAAGNDAGNTSDSSPANCRNVIAVGASGRTAKLSSYSNFGTLVDVTAPGGDGDDYILSTLNAGTTTPGAEAYAYFQGTSMATPHVAGVVALIQSAASTPKTPAEIERLLKNTARPLAADCAAGCGAGLLDASRALAERNTAQGPEYSIYAIAKTYNPGRTALYVLNGHMNFSNYLLSTYTALANTGNRGAWTFEVGDYNRDGINDLIGIAKNGVNGTEVHILDGADNYGSFLLETTLPLGRTGNDSAWVFLAKDYNGDGILDLLAIDKAGSPSGTQLHILDGASKYSKYLLHTTLPIGRTGSDDQWVFTAGDYNADGRPDLYAIDKLGAGGRTAVYVFNGANAFSTFLLKTSTALGNTGTDNAWTFRAGDYNNDRRADLYAFSKAAEGAAQVHVLNAADGYQSYLLHTSMNIGTLGSDRGWELAVGLY